MWERFSFYGMRALLIFYLTKHFLFRDGEASLIYGAYTALVYLTPVIGGILADRYLGPRKAVTYGALLLVLGHLGMAFEGPPSFVNGEVVVRSAFHLQCFFFSLSLIATGVGFLKANISTMVGGLYKQGDSRRDGGFTIFYMGINLGALVSSLLCGYLGETYGWSYGFGAAGVGMLVGLGIFTWGRRHLGLVGEPHDPAKLAEKFAGLSREWWIYLGGFVIVALSFVLLRMDQVVGAVWGDFTPVGIILLIFSAVMLSVIALHATRECTKVERDRLFVASALIFFSVVFFALFEQAGSSLSLFTDRAVDRAGVPASMFQSLNPIFIVLLGPVFSWLWVRLSKRGLEPRTPVKFSFGILLVGLGFLALVAGVKLSGESTTALVGAYWIVLLYLLHTMGELCLSPVGLSMITKLSTPRIVGMMMGVWFLASSFAYYIAGLIAAMTGGNSHGGDVFANLADAKANYVAVYGKVGMLAMGIGFFILLISPILKKGMHERRQLVLEKNVVEGVEEELETADRYPGKQD